MATATTTTMTLQSLPAELVIEIAERLEADGDISALRNLSSTCRTFRKYFKDGIASRVTFTHRDVNASRALAMAGNHNRNITKLRFFDSIPMYTLSDRLEREESWAIQLHPSRATLSNSALQLFQADQTLLPNLDTVSLWFGYSRDFEYEYWNYQGITEEEEDIEPIRKLMNNVYVALSQTTRIRRLDINWPVLESSQFHEESWRTFLGGLEEFTISLVDTSFGLTTANRFSNRNFVQAVEDMDHYFFDHLTHVKKVNITFTHRTPIGAHDGWDVNFPRLTLIPILAGSMPLLTELKMGSFIINLRLINFLAGAACLRKVYLRNVTADLGRNTPNGWRNLDWAWFFTQLVQLNVKLEVFELESPAPLSPLSGNHLGYGPFDAFGTKLVDQEVAVKREMARNPNRRLFGYSSVNNHGHWILQPHRNYGSFMGATDQAAYDAFMATVGPQVAQ